MRGDITESETRLERALDSLDEAIELLEWRYDRDAGTSIARLENLRDELRLALVLAGCSPQPLH